MSRADSCTPSKLPLGIRVCWEGTAHSAFARTGSPSPPASNVCSHIEVRGVTHRAVRKGRGRALASREFARAQRKHTYSALQLGTFMPSIQTRCSTDARARCCRVSKAEHCDEARGSALLLRSREGWAQSCLYHYHKWASWICSLYLYAARRSGGMRHGQAGHQKLETADGLASACDMCAPSTLFTEDDSCNRDLHQRVAGLV